MECLCNNRKQSTLDENNRRLSDGIDFVSSDLYSRSRQRHTIFWRSFDVLRHSFSRSNHKTTRNSKKSALFEDTIAYNASNLRNCQQYDVHKHCKRRNTFDTCDNRTYDKRALELSTDWVIIDRITNESQIQCQRRWVRLAVSISHSTNIVLFFV